MNGRWRRIAGVDSLPPVSFQLATGMRPKLPVVFHFTTKRPNTTSFSSLMAVHFYPARVLTTRACFMYYCTLYINT